MARRNKPYLPLYVQDFLTDEKLMLCSAESVGVYIKIMCLMHKSEEYGTILLKQNFKQSSKQIENFASQIGIFLPFDSNTIIRSLTQLLDENGLKITGDYLIQKRMVSDAELSETRAESGKKGGNKTNQLKKKFAQAKIQANTDIDIENEIDIINKKGIEKKFSFKKSMIDYGFNEDLVAEWINIRTKKKATNSEKAFKDFVSEVEKTGIEKNQILAYITDVSRQWKGFKAEWYQKTNEPTKKIIEPTRDFA